MILYMVEIARSKLMMRQIFLQEDIPEELPDHKYRSYNVLLQTTL